MASLYGYIVNILNEILHLFWISRKSDNSLTINIKSNTGSSISINLDPTCDIKNVKQLAADRLGMNYEELKIIFAGKELDDTTRISECDLGQQSTLHAVKLQSKNVTKKFKPLNTTLQDFQIQELNEEVNRSVSPEMSDTDVETLSSTKAHFYVYCSYQCKSMQTGKLRVRCLQCKSGAIIVDRDPQSWTDVLDKKQISCHCAEEGCQTGPFSWTEFYFKCATQHSSSSIETEECLPLNLVTSNVRKIPCLACTDVCDPILIFPCTQTHVTCISCFCLYVTSRLSERRFELHPTWGYTLPCPAGCPESLIKEVHHFKLLTPEQYSQYQRFAAEDFVLRNGGVLCPQPGCGSGIFAEEGCNKIGCTECGFVFCRLCLQGFHIGPCEFSNENASSSYEDQYVVDPTRAEQARWGDATQRTIRVSTKPCPQCRTATERDGGCMHMICTRCSFSWCWVCQIEWSRECMGSHWFG